MQPARQDVQKKFEDPVVKFEFSVRLEASAEMAGQEGLARESDCSGKAVDRNST
jgi:hypothetical protein